MKIILLVILFKYLVNQVVISSYPSQYSVSQTIPIGGTFTIVFNVTISLTSSSLSSNLGSSFSNYATYSVVGGATSTQTICLISCSSTRSVTISPSQITFAIVCNNPVNPCVVTGTVTLSGLVPTYTIYDSGPTVLSINSTLLSLTLVVPYNTGSTSILYFTIAITNPNNQITTITTTNTQLSLTILGTYAYGNYYITEKATNSDGISTTSSSTIFSYVDPGAVVGYTFLGLFLCCGCLIILLIPVFVIIAIVILIILGVTGSTGLSAGFSMWCCSLFLRPKVVVNNNINN